jgi:putative FmdB family regulatory protein
MPLFVYVCRDCGEEHEILVRGKESPICPGCGSAELVKQASAFAPVMAGSRDSAPSSCGAASGCAKAKGGACPFN